MSGSVLKLSPSSARDFKSCPQLFKYRSVDRLPEPISPAAARGSLVHSVLERLLAEPAPRRTPQKAEELLAQLWSQARDAGEGSGPPGGLADESLLAGARDLLRNYFLVEDPRLQEASKLEWGVELELTDMQLRGIVDRLDVRPDGSWVLSDYKTGHIPRHSQEQSAFFGLRFYALVCWRGLGVMPKQIRLIYLSDPSVLTFTPSERMLVAFERQMQALAVTIRRALYTGDWRPRPSGRCRSCAFRPICPAWPRASGD